MFTTSRSAPGRRKISGEFVTSDYFGALPGDPDPAGHRPAAGARAGAGSRGRVTAPAGPAPPGRRRRAPRAAGAGRDPRAVRLSARASAGRRATITDTLLALSE